MPLPINHGGNLRRQFLNKQLVTSKAADSTGLTERQKANVKKWVSRYRRNWDIYVEEVFGIKLYKIQKIMLHLMGVSDVFFAICTRGAAKSFLVAMGALCEFTLKSYAEIVITSSTVPQAAKLVEKKIRDEIIKKLSPYLLYMYQHEYIVITKSSSSDGGSYTVENKLNGSTIKVLPCLDSARGERSTWNIFEEARLLKRTIVDSVFLPMGHTRPAKYLLKKEYQTNRWLEKARATYITSARYTYEWFYTVFKDTVTNYYISKHEVYTPFGEDIFAAIDDGARTWSDYRKNKRAMGDNDFRCEILNEMLGEADDAFFNYKQFREAQVLTKAFRPYKPLDLIMGTDLGNTPKGENEVRVIAADFAFTETKGANESDFTQFVCMSGHWHKDRFERHIDYMETWPANDDDGAVQRLKELYFDYDADYVIPDVRNGGENIIIQFSKPLLNDERGSSWIARGFGMSDMQQYHVAPKDKLDYYRQRAIDQDYIHCIIPFVGTAANNTAYWRGMKRALDRGMFKMLVSMRDKQDAIENDGSYFQMTSEQLADELAPYGQGDMLIKEAVELTKEIRNDNIKLVEPRSGHKDRIVTAAMANMIIDLIEVEWNKQNQQDNFDADSIQLVW